MARNMNVLLLALLAVTTLFHSSSAQTRHVVGDSTGWTIPTGGASFYTNWAANKTFSIGDTLLFNYAASAHNVEEVTKEKYDSCNSTSPIATYTTSPVTVTINKTGAHYFICGVPGHCLGGQKLSINVTSDNSTTTPPSSTTPSPSSTVTPPPKDSAAVSLSAAGVAASTVMTIAAVFFF